MQQDNIAMQDALVAEKKRNEVMFATLTQNFDQRMAVVDNLATQVAQLCADGVG